MAVTTSEKNRESLPDGGSLLYTVLRYVGLAFVNALALIIVYTFARETNWGLALAIGITTVLANVIIFVPGLMPLRWMLPGIVFVCILTIYPIFYTVYTSFTNYGDGHLLTKEQAILRLEQDRFVSEDSRTYEWTIFQNDAGEFGLWLVREAQGGTEVAFAEVGEPIRALDVDDPTPPETFESYAQPPPAQRLTLITTLQSVVFGEGEDTAQVRNRTEAARPLQQRYVYDEEEDLIRDQQTGTIYYADNSVGRFQARGPEGALNPGYRVNVGWLNFDRLINDPALRGPLIDIILWTFGFALLSVFTTFVVGLFVAITLNDADFRGKRLVRSILILPYAIPAVISILVWQGMINPNIGIITVTLNEWTGFRIPWFSDASWARFAIIMVNLWLGYPYMMLISSGALQAIPSDIYEAAAVDGANPRQKFWNITLPLLLVTMGPLLIASFVYNFNNFLLIDALTAGNPPIPGTPTPAGYTDILISYTYRLAFGSGGGADYGYASAITLVIFAMVAIITLFQYRFTQNWEEVGENV